MHPNKEKLNIKEIRDIQLNILTDVAAFCEKHHIVYFLSSGTLIGAIRHKGYIPWDDDIDIAMPRPDYERFVATYNQSGQAFKVINIDLDKKFPHPFAKVQDPDTILIESAIIKYETGVNIDVFPIDGLPSNTKERLKHQRKIIFLRRIRDAKTRIIRNKRSFHKTLGIIGIRALSLTIPFQTLIKHLDQLNRKYRYEECDYASNLNFGGTDRCFPKSYFEELIDVEFEGKLFKAPAMYDSWLRTIYGNYMEFPPVNKQKSPHGITVYKRNRME